jgi:hypothetical protein
MGVCDLRPPGIETDEICESWLGPQGEQVYWIRQKDDRLWWYSGGNPITAKQVETRAYFYFGARSHLDPMKTWLAFRDAFEGTAVRKVMCTSVEGADPLNIGFSELDSLDEQRRDFFDAACIGEPSRQLSVAINVQYDYRFMAKLALGVGYALFGDSFLQSNYCSELRKGVWFRDGQLEPEMRGAPSLQNSDPKFVELTSVPNTVSLIIAPTPDGMALTLNLGGRQAWMIMCADREVLQASNLSEIGQGQVIALNKYLQKCVVLPLAEFVCHKTGRLPNEGLRAIEARK